MARAARVMGCAFDPAMLVLGACASSTLAIGLAMRCLERGPCDLVLAGGFDEVTVFVAAGFEVLRATTASPPPRPFRLGRDGMALGEGAAVLALARGVTRAHGFVAGFGAASDAFHLTAPDRAGSGLARAAAAALAEAGRPTIDFVSAHATATPFNDAAEAQAIARALDGRRDVPVHPFKAQIGHTLGAAGALELLACVDAIERGVLPAAAGEGEPDPDAPALLLALSRAASPRVALKLSSAFGGANASLVVAAAPGPARAVRPVFVHAVVHVAREPELEQLAAATRSRPDRLARADALVRLALAAVSGLRDASGPLEGAGIVAGSAFATVETNALFAAGIRARGARLAEPRRFPYTSPNAVAGECSIAFGLSGPSFTVGGGPHAGLEALAAAALLVGAGDAERVVVVAVDEAGPSVRAFGGGSIVSGAVALLLSASSERARARVGEWSLGRASGRSGPATPPGHLALLPALHALDPGVPRHLVCASPPDVMAVVRLEPV
jgi:3-oxoacyl-[acyl-carrier-protein] synthase II